MEKGDGSVARFLGLVVLCGDWSVALLATGASTALPNIFMAREDFDHLIKHTVNMKLDTSNYRLLVDQ